MGEDCGLTEEATLECLRLLHRMSAIMWHEEESLRGVVMVDAFAYFVKPASAIICKHTPTATDTTRVNVR